MEALFSFLTPRKPQAERLIALLYHHGLSRTSPALEDSTFDQITSEMRMSGLPEEWARRPRTYFILTQIKRVELMDDFIIHGCDDTSIPFNSLKALPRSDIKRFNHSDAQSFLEWQQVCVSPRLQFEQGRHIRLDDGDVLFEEYKVRLGNGSQMRTTVDRVITRATGRVYARKRIRRNKLPKDAQKEFERELRALKEVEAHQHLIRVCGTYTDKRYLALLLEPVAERTLKDYLTLGGPQNTVERAVFCNFFGCMVKVLLFLHDDKQIIHKDIKPENFLLQGDRIILTDFGTAFDFSKTGQSMTRTNSDDAITPRYASPEVVRDKEFHRASDIWSLGVVFLEMATVLLRRSIKQFDSHLASHGRKSVRIYENRDAALSWLKELRKSDCSPIDNEPLAWIRDMLELSHRSRPTASALFVTSSTCQSGRFCGRCCSDQDTGDSDSEPDSDLLSSHPDILEGKPPARKPSEAVRRASDAAVSFSKGMPGAFPVDAFFVEHRQPVFVEPQHPSFAELPGESLSCSPRRAGSANVPIALSHLHSKRPTETKPNSQMTTLPASQGKEPSQKAGKAPDSRRAKSHNKSRSRKASEAAASVGPSDLTIRDQRVEHFLTSLPAEEQFEQIVEAHDQEEAKSATEGVDRMLDVDKPEPLTSAELRTEHDGYDAGKRSEPQWTRHFKSRKPVKVQSHEQLRPHHECVPYHAEEAMDVCGPLIISYPSDTDLRRHIIELKDHEPDFINSWKQWSANFAFPVPPRRNQDAEREKDQQSQNEPHGTLPATNLEPAPQDHGRKNVASSAPETGTHEMEEASAQVSSDQTDPGKRAKAVTFPEKFEVRVHEIASPKADEEITYPTEAGTLTPGLKNDNDLAPLTTFDSSPTAATALLGSFLEQVPETKKPSRRNWEAATAVMKRILDDKASVAPTSVVSQRTKQMLKGGPWLMRQNDAYYGYLPHFVRLGKVCAVRELLAGGCNPGTQKKPRWQPLFLAVRGATDRHNKCLLALVDHGADVTATHPGNGKTYLHYAVAQELWSGYSTTVYILLETGANPNAIDHSGTTPFLSLLTGAGPLNKEERDALLIFLAPNFDTNVDIRDPNLNDNAFHLTIRRQDPYALDAVLHAVKSDTQKKAMLAERNASGFNPLLLVLSICSFATEEFAENSTRMLELLLEHGADPDSRDETKGNTALHMVIAVHKSTEAVELLLRFKASWTIQNKRQVSARSLLYDRARNEKADPWYTYAEKRWFPDD